LPGQDHAHGQRRRQEQPLPLIFHYECLFAGAPRCPSTAGP
jgi:hypothetical protein